MNKTIEDFIGNTPLVRLQRLDSGFESNRNVILAKLEGDNPAGSVKDRPAISQPARLRNLSECWRLSTAITSVMPRRLRPSTSFEPMKPAAPVTMV